MTDKLSRQQAEAVMAALRTFYAGYIGDDWDGGDLCLIEEWQYPDEPRDWAIVWEEGPEGWAYYFCEHHNAQTGAPFTEPYTGWALCLYPNT